MTLAKRSKIANMINIEFDNASVLAALSQLQRAAADLSPALREIGEVLTESTKQRFAATRSPDGSPWEANTPATLEYKRGNKPLAGETGVLADTINYKLIGNDTLAVGSPMEYAAMQQFGGTKAEFPHLWGDIPARPFLGLSDDDEKEVLEIINDYLEDAINP